MPKLLHELVTHVLRSAPAALLRMLPPEVAGCLPATVQARVTAAELTDLPFHSELARRWYDKGEAEGEAKGEAKLLLKLLALKGFAVSPALRERITGCQDLEQLEAWAGRLLGAQALADVFPDAG